MNGRLPLLISIPHGGDRIPAEVADRVAISEQEVITNSDPLTRRIYDLRCCVEAVVETGIARAIVDLNRAPYDRPPRNPDGVIKTRTPDGTRVYLEGRFPDPPLVRQLLRDYYYPYHAEITGHLDSGRISLGLDCHSMHARAPKMYPDAGSRRPLICLSNRGDEKGEPVSERTLLTCPPDWIRLLASLFEAEFDRGGGVALNDPFVGGFTIRSHYRQKKIPWVQVEINRGLYENPQGDPADLRERIHRVLAQFCLELSL